MTLFIERKVLRTIYNYGCVLVVAFDSGEFYTSVAIGRTDDENRMIWEYDL